MGLFRQKGTLPEKKVADNSMIVVNDEKYDTSNLETIDEKEDVYQPIESEDDEEYYDEDNELQQIEEKTKKLEEEKMLLLKKQEQKKMEKESKMLINKNAVNEIDNQLNNVLLDINSRLLRIEGFLFRESN